MSYAFRPAIRENTPLIIGIAGPTKSGKTMSALRLAIGLAAAGELVMLNAEGARGHQYADQFKYIACDLVPPYRYGMYEEVLREAYKRKPAAIIVDSISHAHDGPGGFLEWHEEELDRLAGADQGKRERANFAAWVRPKAAENAYRYALLEASCPIILCMRAKEKIRIVTGKPPQDLGWQPIVGEGLAFETMFTLMLPPHSKGVPDLNISDMREPFDMMIPIGKPIDENLGRRLAEWAAGAKPNTQGGLERPQREPHKLHEAGSTPAPATTPRAESPSGLAAESPISSPADERAALLKQIKQYADRLKLKPKERQDAWKTYIGDVKSQDADVAALNDLLSWLRARAGE